jgi:NMD protein affecting ribosome stability and mRNA decay
MVQEARHDTYQRRGKLREPTVCPTCGAVFHKGHWTWGQRPTGAHEEVCPACHRIHDRYPAGELSVRGPFVTEHKAEILGLIHNVEAHEKAEHPLSRIMRIDEGEKALVVSTTDTHLARGIGEALHHAYHGEITIQYSEDQQFVRVYWTHD